MSLSIEALKLKQSIFFDADWYSAEYPDVQITGLDPAEHYFQLGSKLERNPSPYFDAKYYLEANRDVKLAGVNPLLHYIEHGHREGRATAAIANHVKATYQSKSTQFTIHASKTPQLHADLFSLKEKFTNENNLLIIFSQNVAELRRALKASESFCENVNVVALVPSVFKYDELVTIESDYKEIDIVTFSIGNQIFALMRLINNDIFYSSVNVFLLNFEDQSELVLNAQINASIEKFFQKRSHNYGLIGATRDTSDFEIGNNIAISAQKLLGRIGSEMPAVMPQAISLSFCYINPLILKTIKSFMADPLGFNPNNREDALKLFKTILLSLATEGAFDITCFSNVQEVPSPINRNIRSIAFYLPQFHVIPENDKWWGKGFSEWHNVVRARPLFKNHYQPRIPADLGFYDLSSTETQIKQAELAKRFNIDAFCYHYYWFDGKKVLNKPIENMLANKAIDIPFCICWANENWSRNWDGQNRHVLLAQSYSEETNKALIREFIQYMKDPRYIRHDDKPVLIVYRISIIPEWRKVAKMWREECRKAGVGEIHLCAVRFGLENLKGDPSIYGLDSYIMFPPHELSFQDCKSSVSNLINDFGGTLYSYDGAFKSDIDRFSKGYSWPVHRGVMMGWDNTARRLKDSRIFFGCTPLKYRRWLKTITEQEQLFNKSANSLIFINAWNEWAEGTTLEPDQRYGTSYLDATYSVLGSEKTAIDVIAPEKGKIVRKPMPQLAKPLLFHGHKPENQNSANLLLCAHISGHQLFGGERSFLDMLKALSNLGYNIVVTLPSSNNKYYIEEIKNFCQKIYVINYKQWHDNRDHDPQVTLAFCDLIAAHAIDLVYANTIVLIEPLKAARIMGIKSLVHCRELITYDAPLQEKIGLSAPDIIRAVFKSCDYLIANSRATQSVFSRENRTFYAPNAIDVSLFPDQNSIEGIIKVGIISSNIPKKGVDDFLKVAQLCQHNEKLQFVVIGPDNKYTEEWKLQQQRGTLPSNIQFAGYINTPQEAISRINLLINTSSFAESFGRTVAEAMAGKRPVIAYEWGALNELVISDKTGYLAPYGDYEQIAKILLDLGEQPQKIIDLGIRAKAHVEENFSHAQLQNKLDIALTHILEQTARPSKKDVLTTIIIPVYNAADEVIQCLDSLYQQTPLHNCQVIIINDGSTDNNIKGIVDSYRDRENTQVYHNENNIGYTKTVNRGIKLANNDSDIILLNSDTRLTPLWTEGLRASAYKDKSIGTVTAMSDNAGAFSFPLFNQANSIPEYLTESEYASLVIATTFDCAAVEVPTGSGFCFYIKRELINTIGTFDEDLFPRGYGEENDFCMRAIEAGFKNIITPWAYVYHARTASFKGEKSKLVEAGVAKVIAKYPQYTSEVKRAFNGEAITALRNAFLNF